MAIQSSFKQQCPSCEAMVPIRDPKLIGRKIDCPKCKYRFVVEEPADEVEEGEEEAPANRGKGVTNKKPVNGKAATAPGKRRPDDDEDLDEATSKKKQGGSGMLIVGIVLAAVAVIALAVGAVFLFSGDGDEDSSSRRQAANAPPSTDNNEPAKAKADTGPVGPKPRVDDITNLLPNDTQVVLNLPLEFLLGNAKVRQALLMTPGAFHEGAFHRIWGISPSNVRRVVLGYNVEKNTVFSVMRTAEQLNEDKIVSGLNLKAEEPINGFKHYLIKKPIDAFSTFLLKGVEARNKLALHFMDKFTVVCADAGPMNEFLKEKGQRRQLSTQPVEKESSSGSGGAPQGGNDMQSRMMQRMGGGGMQGGPPGGMQGGPPAGMQGGPPGGMRGGPPQAGGQQPPAAGGGMKGQAIAPNAGPGGTGGAGSSGFRPPSSMPSTMAPPSMAGGGAASTSAGAASVSSSYLSLDPHLKAALDQAERVDKNENQNVLLSLAVSTSAVSVESVKKSMAEQGGNIPQIPDIALKFGLDAFKSQLKAAAVAVTEFSDSKVVVNAAVGAKDADLAQEWEKRASEALPGLLALGGLDLVAKTAPPPPTTTQGGMAGGPRGGMMMGMGGPPAGMQGGGPPAGMQGGPPAGMQGGGPPAGMQGQQQQMMRRMMMQQQGGGGMGGMRGGMMGGPGGNPNMQQPGADQQPEEKGKQGNYELWTKDDVLAASVNFTLSPAHLAGAGVVMEWAGIYLRSVSAMADRSNRIHELAAAMQAYFEEKGHFPRGTVSAPASDRALDWRPDQRLSWMTLILPYLGDGEFKGFKTVPDKAWYEDPTNEKLGLTVIPQFVAPIKSDNPIYYYVSYPNLPVKGPGLWAATHYVGIAGVGLDAAEYRAGDPATDKKRGVFGYDRETKKSDIKDGLAQTIVLIQVPPDPKSPWIAGGGSTVRGVSEDLDCVQPFVCAEYQGKPGTFAIMADGKVRFIPANIDPKTFQAMCTIAGGDKITNLDKVAPEVPVEEEPSEPELKAKEVPAPAVQKPAPQPKLPPAPKRPEAAPKKP